MSPLPRTARPPHHPARRLLAAAVTALLAAAALVAGPSVASAAGTLLSQGRPTTASSSENAGTAAGYATDGNPGTRWSSAFGDPQWLQVDLGATATVSQVTLTWEAAYARAYQIQTSTDGASWTTVYATTTGDGGTDDLTVTGTGRYVRVYGTARATAYGYSLWEFQVYGTTGTGGGCGATNTAKGRPATASSVENAGTPASAAVDGDTGTRWSSAFGDPQWLRVDLGAGQSICRVTLTWEAAYARAYQIQTSTDGTSWTTVYATTTGDGGTDAVTVSGTGRYLRVYGTVRATAYGYSLWELAVNTTGGTTIPGGGSLGPNVLTFDPSMSGATIQNQLDTVFRTQEANQFGTQRYALLFKPGDYSGINAQIGFYTSIMGLGRNPGDVRIHGDVTVDAGWFNGNATQNFWRSASNMQVFPSAGFTRWAVSQAAPFRRMDIQGDLNLAPAGYGWASGGYIADSRVTGIVQPYSQQQWYTRDSNVGGYQNAVWNVTNSGVVGAPATSFPNPPYTTLARTPVSRDVPYLYLDAAGGYNVFVPSTRTNASGASWLGGSTPGTSLPLSQFYVAHPGDSAATINAALAQGLNLLFTPGVYDVTETITVNRPGTVVLGLGFPTLIPQNGVTAMSVADVDGVRLAGLLLDAGPINSPVLLRVGTAGATASHAADPTSIQDVFFRIGGAGAGKATTSLVVNSNDTLIDHIWAWRADHGTGVGWTVNTADTGLVVNGANVTALGLFVEHYQKYEVVWNGENGRIVFFQNELPYDPPNAAAWTNGSMVGYAAVKVAGGVSTFEGWGMGSYCYFNVDPTITAYHSFEAPVAPGVRFHDLLTVSLGGNGSITHVVNDTGATAQGTATVPVNLVSYP
ncbi:discoidin domain-containing protein [Micromonospora siamensis]|uniref:F5/8 type C domain-containing protein n=1 Tax=Micromonospora siamensis TaxID=299152 RepID=A0A1C5IG38_9ACTN|nr:discoidin domain-containing protein [Micromonospora siamensis]SCG57330.1 F5/8 type C domain-containing protein [Micromonospora siamensis]